ncbi:MAG: hypothetical protein Q8936_06050 [Bacillota bacterium]|nr:hypothetical protein [Bacillota bacterium]
MTITYQLENSLYVNVTNKCHNACSFCVRNREGAFMHDLWLEKDPTSEEIINEIYSKDLKIYKEIVFCGLEAYSAILDFTKRCKQYVNDVQLSVVDCLPVEDIEICKRTAQDLGVNFKIRKEVK